VGTFSSSSGVQIWRARLATLPGISLLNMTRARPNVGWQHFSTSLSAATGFSRQELAPIYVRLGDLRETAFEAVKEAKRFHGPTISLAEVESIITRLSELEESRTDWFANCGLSHATPSKPNT